MSSVEIGARGCCTALLGDVRQISQVYMRAETRFHMDEKTVTDPMTVDHESIVHRILSD